MTAPLRQTGAHRRIAPASVASADSSHSNFGMVGRNTALAAAVQLGRRVAASPATTVLIGGETGTGKELFARGIHAAGPTAGAPFVAINCSAIPESLLEGELFGHEAGAYTGARGAQPGLAESAGTGTLFLDEIGELPLALQPKLLRLLEERTARRLGGSREYDVRCRIVAGTNVQLERAVADGRFRADLYYRLNVVRVDLPPLRERRGDIALLAGHFAREIASRRGGPARVLDPSAVAALEAHHWPGNVRELRNVMERATLLADGPVLRADDIVITERDRFLTPGIGMAAVVEGEKVRRREGELPTSPHSHIPTSSPPAAPAIGTISIPESGLSLAEIEREAIRLTMLHTAGNLSAAARILGISRPTLTRRLRESGLTRRSLLASK
jgi:DNA-binding NtrC family response regulator